MVAYSKVFTPVVEIENSWITISVYPDTLSQIPQDWSCDCFLIKELITSNYNPYGPWDTLEQVVVACTATSEVNTVMVSGSACTLSPSSTTILTKTGTANFPTIDWPLNSLLVSCLYLGWIQNGERSQRARTALFGNSFDVLWFSKECSLNRKEVGLINSFLPAQWQ